MDNTENTDLETNETIVSPNSIAVENKSTGVESNGKFMSQDDLDRIAQANKQRGYEKALKEFQSQQTGEIDKMPKDQSDIIAHQVQSELNKIYQQQLEEAQRIQLEQKQAAMLHEMNEAYVTLAPQVEKAKEKYSDYADVVKELGNLPEADHIVRYASKVPNSADVLYALAKSPSKVFQIKSMLNDPNGDHFVNSYMNQLSKSISANEESPHTQAANSPLSSIKSTPVKNSGKLTGVTDWKNFYKGKL